MVWSGETAYGTRAEDDTLASACLPAFFSLCFLGPDLLFHVLSGPGFLVHALSSVHVPQADCELL